MSTRECSNGAHVGVELQWSAKSKQQSPEGDVVRNVCGMLAK